MPNRCANDEMWFLRVTSVHVDESLLERSTKEGDSPVHHLFRYTYGSRLLSRVLWDKSAKGW